MYGVVHRLRGDLAESTAGTYASCLHRFYDSTTQVGTFDSNPMALVVEEMNESIDEDPTAGRFPSRRCGRSSPKSLARSNVQWSSHSSEPG